MQRRAGWIGPVAAAVVVAALGWWAYTAVRAELRRRTAVGLQALVDTEASLLRSWCADRQALGGSGDISDIAEAVPAMHPGEGGELLVFDKRGTLIVPGRFDGEARHLGLPTPVDLRDPGGDLRAGFQPSVARTSLPLTKMAGHATSGEDGADLLGYRNYLGAEVVGAWRWVPELDIGIGAELPLREAFAPANVLLRVFWSFVILCAAAGGIGALVARRNAKLLRDVREAEKKARKLGQYTLAQKIGEGGMGEVYLARHAMLRRPTSIKLLRADRTNPQTIARFEREVQQTTRLTHPNTVQIYDFGRTPGGTFYYAMEFLVGVGLDTFVADMGPLEEGRVIYILQQVCGSLNEAHGLGLVHRDIKPENIILCSSGGAYDVVKVLDFGLVMDRGSEESLKLSAAGAILGTPGYMSPEAFTDPEKVDARSDIYSLGCVGYFLLTGRPPFEGKTIVELFSQHTKVKPVPPSERTDLPIAPDIEQAIMACLAKSPAARPKDANALSRELEWCRALGEWNRDQARYWWNENEARLEEQYGLSSMARMSPSASGSATIEIKLDDR